MKQGKFNMNNVANSFKVFLFQGILLLCTLSYFAANYALSLLAGQFTEKGGICEAGQGYPGSNVNYVANTFKVFFFQGILFCGL